MFKEVKLNIETIKELDKKDNKEVSVLKVSNQEEEDDEVEEKEETEKLKKEKEVTKTVGFFKLLFAMADKSDVAIITCAILGSLVGGASMPLISLLLGKVLNKFDENNLKANVPQLVSGLVTNFLIVGLGILVGSAMMVFFWNLTGRRLINKINADYFRVIMLQEQAWFDKQNKFDFSTKVQSQIKTIEGGVSKL